MKLTEEEMQKLTKSFENKEGQKYPCSNQHVICAIFTEDEDKAFEIMKQYKAEKFTKYYCAWRKDDEYWYKLPFQPFRGKRYYKIKIDKNVDKDFFYQNILPCCVLYCCEMEFI